MPLFEPAPGGGAPREIRSGENTPAPHRFRAGPWGGEKPGLLSSRPLGRVKNRASLRAGRWGAAARRIRSRDPNSGREYITRTSSSPTLPGSFRVPDTQELVWGVGTFPELRCEASSDARPSVKENHHSMFQHGPITRVDTPRERRGNAEYNKSRGMRSLSRGDVVE